MTFIPHQRRVVLDTNVCLDLFVFRDPRWTTLITALKQGDLQAVTRADCRAEWQIVLSYPKLPLDSETRAQSAAAFDAIVNCLPTPHLEQSAVRLPLCSDPDDQKFLELARDAGAEALITKDKALLRLAKKTARAGLFAILTPEGWIRDELRDEQSGNRYNAGSEP